VSVAVPRKNKTTLCITGDLNICLTFISTLCRKRLLCWDKNFSRQDKGKNQAQASVV
jgi:hypothetical protein